MDVILLERVAKLGHLGDTVTVKDGYARNFLLPKGKALRANKANQSYFDGQRAVLEAKNEERKTEAEAFAAQLNGNTYIAVRSAGETGQLYGSVAARDIVQTLADNDFKVGRSMVDLRQPIKVIGLHEVLILLHPEVEATITMNVARSEDEAVRQAAGEDLTSRDAFDRDDEVAEEDELSIDDVFDNPEDAEAAAETLDDAGATGPDEEAHIDAEGAGAGDNADVEVPEDTTSA
ncbi:50S ribosomal protein L9 [Ahrensia sp. R2A130]|uniref:50S ribosomal protein L9 n=1 Tax=Ahrensia sp. R2A130 TaxID=744979 RepID=UPI0001E09C1A|nr:50S ribosomal protein L9 [Ahrensia sp. R2A130]EFL90617.1 50S ribosomal protein L9 [Ahrensia sp. R2A130]